MTVDNIASGASHVRHFFHRLESLRGVAALFVAVHHSLWMIAAEGPSERLNRGLQGVFYGRGAVLCFFVLSGLVLGESLRRISKDKVSGSLTFYLRRILRIYPASILAIGLCAIIHRYYGFWKIESDAATSWYEGFYAFPYSFANFLNNLCFLESNLNPDCWSLAVEIVASLLLPLFHFASLTNVSRAALFVGLFSLQFVHTFHPILNLLFPYLWTFYLGYLIPLWPAAIWLYFAKHRRVLIAVLAVSIGVCVTTLHFGHRIIPYSVAIGFIVAAIHRLSHDPLFSFLDHAVFKFYGRISFSFYLLHWPIVYSLSSFLFFSIPAPMLVRAPNLFACGIALLSIGLTTPAAWLSYHFIEKPCVRLGKALRHRSETSKALGASV